MSNIPIDDLITSDEDFRNEQEVLRNPYELKPWWRYIEAKRPFAKPSVINLLFERALHALPGSYKLWYNYLDVRMKQVERRNINDPAYEAVNNCFERALVTMHKMPVIWLEYCKFLMKQRYITRTRKTFDRALQALPISQHDRIWKLYIQFVQQPFVPHETSMRVFNRYIKFKPEAIEDFIDYLIDVNLFNEACIQLTKVINDDEYVSPNKKTKHEFWMKLCELLAKYPTKIQNFNAENVIRSGIKKYTSDVGQLWCYLATYYIQLGLFEKACDIYEEAMENVSTVRDFHLIFSAYSKFQDEIISTKMSAAQEEPEEEDENVTFTNQDDLEMRIAKLEYLMDRRPELLSSVKLRQNPHNVHEWHKRVKLYSDDPKKVIETYTKAVEVVDPMKASGKPHTLWIAFAKYYEKQFKDFDMARKIFETATKQIYRTVDDLASVWCEYVEFELRNKNFSNALKLLQRATRGALARLERKRKPRGIYDEDKYWVHNNLYKSVKLWSLYADVQESLGDIDGTRDVYEKMIDLKVATPQTIINYAEFLEEHKYFEASFRAYEKGIGLFSYPQVYHIWVNYLTKFMHRYQGKKIERARELFEQATENVPPEYAKGLYLLYAKLEEDYGLARRAMAIYDKACSAVKPEEQYEMFCIYINRAAEYFGVTKTRAIYEKAIDTLPDEYIKGMCLRYAEMERKLGEIDRARAIFVHGANFCNPKTDKDFWDKWYEFEKFHGNPDTAREMLRIKRSVQASFATTNIVTQSMLEEHKKEERIEEEQIENIRKRKRETDTMAELEAKVEKEANPEEIDLSGNIAPAPGEERIKFVPKKITQEEEKVVEEKQENPEEIVIEEVAFPKTLYEKNVQTK